MEDYFKDIDCLINGNIDSKDLIVVLHGGPGMSFNYISKYLLALERQFEVFYYNYQIIKPYSIESLLAELHTIILNLRAAKATKKIHFLSHSFGSILAIKYIIKYPQSISSATLSSWIYDHQYFEISKIKRKPQVEKIKRNQSKQIIEQDIDIRTKNDFLSFSDLYFREDFRDEGIQLLKNTTYNGELFYHFMQGYIESFSLKSELRKISIPILSIIGLDDGVVDSKYIEAGQEEIANVECQELHTGHFPFIEETEKFNHLIINFIKTINPKEDL